MKPLKGYEEYNVPNWDGYGAEPIVPETLALAQVIFDMIDERGDAAPGGDGSICMEWRRGDDILCLDIGPSDQISIYGKIAGKHVSSNRAKRDVTSS